MLQNSTHTQKKFKCHLVKNNDILDQKSYPCFSNGWKGKLASIAMRLSNIAKEKKKNYFQPLLCDAEDVSYTSVGGSLFFDAVVAVVVGNAMEKEEKEESLPVPFQLQIHQPRLGVISQSLSTSSWLDKN